VRPELFRSVAFAAFANHAKWIIAAGKSPHFWHQFVSIFKCFPSLAFYRHHILYYQDHYQHDHCRQRQSRIREGMGTCSCSCSHPISPPFSSSSSFLKVIRIRIHCHHLFLSTNQVVSNNIHPRVIFVSDGKGGGGGDALGGGGWVNRGDVGDVKVTRLAAAASPPLPHKQDSQAFILRFALALSSPSQVTVWPFETIKPWHMLDPATQPVT